MTQQPPSPGSDRRDPLSFDELIALIVAFSVVGVILWWGIGRNAGDWLNQRVSKLTGNSKEVANLFGFSSPPDATDADQAVPSPEAQVISPQSPAAVVPTVPQPEVSGPRLGPIAGGAIVGGAAVIAPAVIAPAVVAPESPIASASPEAVPSPAESPAIVVPSASAEAAPTFSDVPNDYWAYPFITELSKRGVLTGVSEGQFQPDQPLNRAQYAALVSNVLPENQQAAIEFNDVSPTFWGAQAIDKSVQSGFVKGYLDKTFQPDQPISRMQVLLSLVNGFGFAKSANPDPALAVFQDQDQIPDWAKPAIGTAAQSGLVASSSYPDDKLLNPEQPATRAEVAAMLYQALTASGKLPPIQSNYILRP